MAELQVHEDLTFQRREWVAQRLAWIAMAAVLAAAAIGLFGSGPISEHVASNEDGGMQVEYNRFGRFGAFGSIQVEISDAQPEGDGTLQLAVGREYAESVRIEQVVPEPQSVAVESDWLLYEFELRAAGELVVTFELMYQDRGRVTGRIRSPDGETVTFRQFVHP